MQEFFNLLNSFYDKIYVLSVASAEVRRKLFSERFKGLNFSFYFGADKNNFTKEQLVEKGIYDEKRTAENHRYGKTMLPGEIACAWSHKMIYEDIMKNRYAKTLIFEDDAVPDPSMVKKIPFILEEIPGDCELLFWGWDKNGETNMKTVLKKNWYHLQHTVGQLKWDHTIINNLFAKPYSPHLKKAGFHDYTYAYAVSKSGVSKLLGLQDPIQYIADNLLSIAATKKIINGYITYPPVFLHDALPDGTARDSYIR